MSKNLKTYRPRLSPAMVVALLALVVASSMPAQAAVERLAKGSVGTAQLKNGAVTTPKIRHGAVTGPKIRNGTIGLGDLSSSARPKLPDYRGSDNGGVVLVPSGVWTTVLTLSLPAGRWFVFGKGYLNASESTVTCDLASGDRIWDRTKAALLVEGDPVGHAFSPMSLGQRIVLGSAGKVEIRCTTDTGNMRALDTKLNAIQVRS